jgi:hypothetical protein
MYRRRQLSFLCAAVWSVLLFPIAAYCQNLSGTCPASTSQCLAQISAQLFRGQDASKDADAVRLCNKLVQQCTASKENHSKSIPPNIRPMSTPTIVDVPSTGRSVQERSQRIFVRADNLDNPYPGLTQSGSGQALGASLGYTANDFVQSTTQTKTGPVTTVSNSSSITFSGLATILLQDPLIFEGDKAWVPALWLSANGNWDNPTKTFGDTSALKGGGKIEYTGGTVGGTNWSNYFDASAFYQTDFYGIAEAQGAAVSWSPMNTDLFLGGADPTVRTNLAAGFWEMRAEFADVDVTIPGHTLLRSHNYEWYGFATRGYIFFFPSKGSPYNGVGTWPSYITDRFSFVGTIQSYWDANSRAAATLYSAAFQYKFACGTKDNPGACDYGVPSLTLQYDYGTDRDTLQQKKLLSLKFNYAF